MESRKKQREEGDTICESQAMHEESAVSWLREDGKGKIKREGGSG